MFQPSSIAQLLLFLFLPMYAMGATPINIEADTLDIDEKHGLSVYKGNVRVSQGDLNLSANQVILYSENKRLQRLVAKGKPVRINVSARGNRKAMRAEALEMEYRPLLNQVIMENQAHLWQGKNEFSSHYIEYKMDRDVISAKSSEQKQNRVRVTIHPEEEKNSDKKQEKTNP